MHDITMKDAELVGGSGPVDWVVSQIARMGVQYVGGAVASGQVDYSGLAETQGHYYNMVGA